MNKGRLRKYLFNIFILFLFSFISASVSFQFVNTKNKFIKKKKLILKKVIVKNKSFITKKDFDYFLNWSLDKIEAIDVKELSFIAIEELYNTSKILVNALYLKKIRSVLKGNINNKKASQVDIELLLNKMDIKNRFVRRSRDYILLRLKFEQKKYELFVADYEKNIDFELKNRLKKEYISSLLSINKKEKAIDVFKDWFFSPTMKITKLETLLSKTKLKILFSNFIIDDWIRTFVFFINEGKQGTIKKLSEYTGSRQLTALFNAEYNYSKKKYSRAKRLLKKVNNKNLLGFKKRILYKIRLRDEKYDLVLSQSEELSAFPIAYSGFLLNAAKLSMKDRPDLSRILFEKYIAIKKNEQKKQKYSDTESSEYWGAMWRLAWLYYKDGEQEKVKILLKETTGSEFLSYKISSEYWLAKLEKRDSKLINQFPFSYYYIAQRKIQGKHKIEVVPDSFRDLFPKRKTILLENILVNVKLFLKYGLVNECTKYIDEEIKNPALNITEKNYLKLIPLIVSVREEKYGKSIWTYGRSFKNYRSIQLPKYLREIVAPVKYGEIIHKYSYNKLIDPYLVMALIKQESTFKASVVSPSKAHGLMQLLLKTANLMSKKYKRKVYRANLFNPETNIKYGVEYLKELIDKYNGNIYYALAAYNAGDHRVDSWLLQIGNVTNEEFVEMIPFTETRNYVKLVIRNYYYYKFYYDKDK